MCQRRATALLLVARIGSNDGLIVIAPVPAAAVLVTVVDALIRGCPGTFTFAEESFVAAGGLANVIHTVLLLHVGSALGSVGDVFVDDVMHVGLTGCPCLWLGCVQPCSCALRAGARAGTLVTGTLRQGA